MTLPRPLAYIAAGLLALPLLAAGADARAGCIDTDPGAEQLAAASVTAPGPRVHFVQDGMMAAGCPSDAERCRAKAFVVRGDVVLTSGTQGGFTCARYVNAKGVVTVNWLPTAALTPLSPAIPPAEAWVGHWVAIEMRIGIKRAAGGALAVSGDATWGSLDPERVRRGGVNIGEVQGTATPVNGVLAFTQGETATLPYESGDQDACRIRMVLRGPYMVATDNRACGGNNVSFSGIYRRAD